MNLLIPTYRRPNDQKTWHTLAPELREFVTFVVRPDEADHFRKTYAPSKVVETAPHVHDFSTTLQFVFDTFADRRFIYMDDDLQAFYRRRRFFEPVETLPKPFATVKLETAEQQLDLFARLLKDLDIPYVGCVGVRQAFLPPYYDRYRHAQANIQLMAVDGATVKKVGARWDRLKWHSDIDFNLMLNHAGYDTLQRNDFYYTEPGFFEGEGGSNAQIAGAARIAEVKAHHDLLVQLWPDVIKPTARKGQTGKGHITGYTAHRKKHLDRRRVELGLPSVKACMEAYEDHQACLDRLLGHEE